MSTIIGTRQLHDYLVAAGIEIPAECTGIEIHFPVDGALDIQYTCHVTKEQLPKILSALQAMHDDHAAEEQQRNRLCVCGHAWYRHDIHYGKCFNYPGGTCPCEGFEEPTP